MRTILPLLAMSFTFSTTLKALVESRPEVGSSRNNKDGLWIMSIPIETLRRSPPDTPLLPSSPINGRRKPDLSCKHECLIDCQHSEELVILHNILQGSLDESSQPKHQER